MALLLRRRNRPDGGAYLPYKAGLQYTLPPVNSGWRSQYVNRIYLDIKIQTFDIAAFNYMTKNYGGTVLD